MAYRNNVFLLKACKVFIICFSMQQSKHRFKPFFPLRGNILQNAGNFLKVLCL